MSEVNFNCVICRVCGRGHPTHIICCDGDFANKIPALNSQAPSVPLDLLVSCAEWHEQQAMLEREDMDSKGGPGTEHWDECLSKVSMHCIYANALRAASSS